MAGFPRHIIEELPIVMPSAQYFFACNLQIISLGLDTRDVYNNTGGDRFSSAGPYI